MTQKLLPCPFCGGEAEFQRIGTHRTSCIISCTQCDARLETGEENERCGRRWNTRQQPALDLPRDLAEIAKIHEEVSKDPRHTDKIAHFHRGKLLLMVQEVILKCAKLMEEFPDRILYFYDRPGGVPGNIYVPTNNKDRANAILSFLPEPITAAEVEHRIISAHRPHCHAGRDGDCIWHHCPQNVPGNYKSHCPLDTLYPDEET